jgi:predicted ATP-dependent endonuclease of OLD family
VKIKRLTIKNVTSYKARTDFHLDKGINILIGPNGGGKSNFQKILALVLSKYLILQYEFRFDDNQAAIVPIDFWTRRVIARTLERFMGDDTDQEIELELVPGASDVNNIKAIGNNLERFNEHLTLYERPFQSYAPLPSSACRQTKPQNSSRRSGLRQCHFLNTLPDHPFFT